MPSQQQELASIHYPRPVNHYLSSHTILTRKTIRTPDNSFPIQEESEDDHDQRNDWLSSQNESVHRSSSPVPFSDLCEWSYREESICDSPNESNSRAGHRTADDETIIEQSLSMQEEEGHSRPSPRPRRPRLRLLPSPSPRAHSRLRLLPPSPSPRPRQLRPPPSPRPDASTLKSSLPGSPLLSPVTRVSTPDPDPFTHAHRNRFSNLRRPGTKSDTKPFLPTSLHTTLTTPDKSLPIQEEPEDDHVQAISRNNWLPSQNESIRQSSSPTDLYQWSYPEGYIRDLPNGRNSRDEYMSPTPTNALPTDVSMLGNKYTPTPVLDGESLDTDDEDEGDDQPARSYKRQGTTSNHNHLRSPYRAAATKNVGGKTNVSFTSRSHHSLPPPPRPHNASTHSLGRTSIITERERNHSQGQSSVVAERRATQRTEDDNTSIEQSVSMQEEEGRAPPSPQQYPLSRDSSGTANHTVVEYYPLSRDFSGTANHTVVEYYTYASLRESPPPDISPVPQGTESNKSVETPGSVSHDPRRELPTFNAVARVDFHPYPFAHIRRNYYNARPPKSDKNVEAYSRTATLLGPSGESSNAYDSHTAKSRVRTPNKELEDVTPVEATTGSVGHWQTMTSYLHSVLLKKDLYKILLSQTADQAQSLLNLLHQVCISALPLSSSLYY